MQNRGYFYCHQGVLLGAICLMITTFSLTLSFRARLNPPVEHQTATLPTVPLRFEPIRDDDAPTDRFFVWYPPTQFFYIPTQKRWVSHRPKYELPGTEK
ncbi:MAG: hypothetical protein Q7S64_00035 [bacterium]|nr:hypothetical protein [bacterium]